LGDTCLLCPFVSTPPTWLLLSSLDVSHTHVTSLLNLMFCIWIHGPLMTSCEIADELTKHDDTPSLQGTTCIPTMTQMFPASILKVWDRQFCFYRVVFGVNCLGIMDPNYVELHSLHHQVGIYQWIEGQIYNNLLFFIFFPKLISKLVTRRWFTKSQRPKALRTQIFINKGPNQYLLKPHYSKKSPLSLLDSWPWIPFAQYI
jgi:hypothetical protein